MWAKFNNEEALKQHLRHYSDKNSFREKYDISTILVTRFKDVYQINLPWSSVSIQITSCNDLDRFCKQIDIGCTEIMFTSRGKDYEGDDMIYISKTAKFELENLVITVDHTRYSEGYIQRLFRYFGKGFDLILPLLDMEKIPKRNVYHGGREVLDLPYFYVDYGKIDKNKIIGSLRHRKFATENEDSWGSGKRKTQISEIIHDNICKIARNDYTSLTYWGEGENFRNAFMLNISITERQLRNTYAAVSKEVIHNNHINLEKIEKYFPVIPMKQLTEELISNFFTDNKSMENDFSAHAKKYIDRITEQQLFVSRANIKNMETEKSISEEVKREKQSFLRVDPKLWYGDYYFNPRI